MTECSIQSASNASFFHPSDPIQQQVVFGAGVSVRVGEFAKQLGSHALVITDAGVLSAGHPQKIIASLQSAGLKTYLFDGTIENPTDSSIRTCAREVAHLGIDLIVGVGGGSSLDTAKGTNFILTNGGSMQDYWGVGKAERPLLPMIAIPTTAGTGSECQSYALISHDQTHRKMACGDSTVLPKVTLLDPQLTLSQPFSVCAATGMDALAHTLESVVCKKRNARSDSHARKGFCLLMQNLNTVWNEPENLDARGKVLLGAAHAGAAIERSMLGAAHAMANPLTSHRGVVHGQAVGLTLPAVLSYNQKDPKVGMVYAQLARESGLTDSGASDSLAFDILLKKVLYLRKISNLPTRLSSVGFEPSSIKELSKDAADQWTAGFNPRPVGEPELSRIYQSIDSYAG